MGKVGIIGGSGLYAMEGLKRLKTIKVKTPFGDPSEDYVSGTFDGIDVVFLPRHGKGHRISPSEINYRANIFGMKKLGVDAIISVSACGSLKEELRPMDFVIPNQFLDRTNRCRQATFFTGGIVAHLAFADPVCPQISEILYRSAKELGISVHKGGTYVNMEGPQFSTKAESNLYRSWGMDIIGMTNLTEAKLAREAEISYATLAAVTDYDCWHEGHETVSIEMIISNLNKNIVNSREILKHAIPQVGRLKNYSAQGTLQYAIVTDPKCIPAKVKKDLKIIIGKYIK